MERRKQARQRRTLDIMKILFLIRGTSGSGKSSLAKLLTKNQITADDCPGLYRNGKYQLNLQQKAHDWCFDLCVAMLKKALPVVAVHNTFTKLKYLDRYIQAGKNYGYKIIVIRTEGNYGNLHGVPIEVLIDQEEKYELYGEIKPSYSVSRKTKN